MQIYITTTALIYGSFADSFTHERKIRIASRPTGEIGSPSSLTKP
jgi:hypothetical protein